MPKAIAAPELHIAVVQHLEALYDTRDCLLDQPDGLGADDANAIDAQIERYARECPDAFGLWIKHCKAKQDGVKVQRDALANSYKKVEAAWCSREAAARDMAMHITKAHGTLQGEVFSITYQQNKRLDVFDESKIPAEYWTVIPETRVIDRARVEKALKGNYIVPGARLVDGTEFVTVKGA